MTQVNHGAMDHCPAARWIMGGAASYAVLGGLSSFAGWVFDVPRLTVWTGHGISIQPNAALCALAAGLALWLTLSQRSRAAAIVGGIVGWVGTLTLLENLTHVDLGIDRLFMFERPWGRMGTAAPGRMGVPASTSWVLLGTAFVLHDSHRLRRHVSRLGLLVLGISLLSVIGYLFGADQLYALPRWTAIAFQTATFLLALSLGLIASVPDQEPMRTLFEDSSAGIWTRRSLPGLILLPVVLVFVLLKGHQAGLYDTGMSGAMLVVTWLIVMRDALWRAARAVAKRERDLAAAHERIHQAEQRLVETLQETDRRKDEFLATLAHELRNPLAPITSAFDILVNTENVAAQQRARDIMQRQLAHLVRLIDDLIDLSRINRGSLELRPERVELASILRQAIEVCQPLIDAAGHKLRVELPRQPFVLDADAVRLVQVFGNLLNNAGRFTDPGGHIDLVVEREGSDAVVAVTDSGVGIPPEMLERIFEMFMQLNRRVERARGGLGIGLSLAKRIVEMHGGTVTAYSDGEGNGGSKFVVRLPIVIANNVTQTAAPIASDNVPRRRVLLVDDNRDAVEMLALLLQAEGNEVQTVFDGEAAFTAADAMRPDVILLDIGLPKMNGYDVCRAIRQQTWGKDIAIFALSGWGQSDDRSKSLDAGFDEHLTKPASFPAIAKLLNDCPARTL